MTKIEINQFNYMIVESRLSDTHDAYLVKSLHMTEQEVIMELKIYESQEPHKEFSIWKRLEL